MLRPGWVTAPSEGGAKLCRSDACSGACGVVGAVDWGLSQHDEPGESLPGCFLHFA